MLVRLAKFQRILVCLGLLALVSPVAAAGAYTPAQQAKLTAADGAAGDFFGYSVSVDGDTAAVGAIGDDNGGDVSGSASVFARDAGGDWNQQAKLTPSDGAEGAAFGNSVAVDGTTAVVGAYLDDDNGDVSGSAYVFVNDSGGNWKQQAKLTPSDGAEGDFFGLSASVDGDTAVMGAYLDDDNGDDSGSAYVFVRDNEGNWSQQAKLTASDGAADDRLGTVVSVDGDTAVVGAAGDDDNGNNSGSAYVFVRDNEGNWSQQAKLTASDGAEGDFFGLSASVGGDTVVVGAAGDDDNGDDSGSAYVFVMDNEGNWSQQAKFTASDSTESDFFGFSASADGDMVVVGAIFSAYVFARDAGGNWSQQAKLTASDGVASAPDPLGFGHSVSVDSGTAVVGAFGDEDKGTESGSAYVYLMEPSSAGGDSISDNVP